MQSYIPVTDIRSPQLALFLEKSERVLRRWDEPRQGLFVAESPNVIMRALEAGYVPEAFLADESILGKAEADFLKSYPEVPVYTGSEAVLKQMTGFAMTKGMLSLMRRRQLPSARELCMTMHRIVVLEDVVNPTNVGAVFRSAAALGAEMVLLTKGCSDPLYRRCARVSMGTVFQIPWAYVGDDWMEMLGDLQFQTVAMALEEDSYALDDPVFEQIDRLAIVMGTEGEGLQDKTIEKADYTVCIPMSHGVDSLNVAAASAVAFWQLCRKRK